MKIDSAFLFLFLSILRAEKQIIHSHEISIMENADIGRHLKLQILTKIMTKICRSPKKSINLFPNFICEKVLP